MDHLWGAFRGGLEAELLEQLQHRAVLGQHFRNQFLETCVTRKGSQMAHQDRPNALTLIVINHDESDFCVAWLDDDKSSPACDDRMSIFVDLRNERDMGFEIDNEKKGHFPFGKALLWNEEASLKRLHAGAPDRREHVGPVIGTKRTDFNRTAVAKMLWGRIICGFNHDGSLLASEGHCSQTARIIFLGIRA